MSTFFCGSNDQKPNIMEQLGVVLDLKDTFRNSSVEDGFQNNNNRVFDGSFAGMDESINVI